MVSQGRLWERCAPLAGVDCSGRLARIAALGCSARGGTQEYAQAMHEHLAAAGGQPLTSYFVVTRPILPAFSSVNQRLPLGPAVMLKGSLLLWGERTR
jgi:hypothetical protein